MAMIVRDKKRADAALLARRCTMFPDAALIDRLSGQSRSAQVSTLLSAPLDKSKTPRKTPAVLGSVEWWNHKLVSNPSLQNRMAFLWHTLIPTNRTGTVRKGWDAIQIDTLRAHSLGNYRDLLHAMLNDPLVAFYLDALISTKEKVNENLPRELMELFSVGIGNFTEDDVRGAAQAMTGYMFDPSTGGLRRIPRRSSAGPFTIFGETKNWDTTQIVDRLCDNPATAARIGSRVWYHFTGQVLSGGAPAELGRWWQGKDLEIRPLLERIFLSAAFWNLPYVRPRSGFEYYAALHQIGKFKASQHLTRSQTLGQAVYFPPNVGGWPEGDRWLSPDSMLRRADQVLSVSLSSVRPRYASESVDEILDACSLYVVSDKTKALLDTAWAKRNSLGTTEAGALTWRLAMSCPEFNLL